MDRIAPESRALHLEEVQREEATWKFGLSTIQGPQKLHTTFKPNTIPNSFTETLGPDGDWFLKIVAVGMSLGAFLLIRLPVVLCHAPALQQETGR